MSTNSTALACKLEDFKQLDNKPFHKYTRGYLEIINRNLSSAEFRIYTYLKEQSLRNYKEGGIVIQSAYEIGKGVDRSPRTAEKHLSSLRAKGYIDLHKSKSDKSIYRRNCIRLTCPQTILKEILSASPNIVKFPKEESTVYLCPSKTSEYPDDCGNHSFNNRNIDKSNIKTNIRETSPLCDLEPVDETLKYPLEYPLQNESVEQNVPRGTFLGESEAQNFKGVEFDRFKTEAEVARFITKAERKQIVTKVKAMKRDGEIHPKVQANYQDIMVLVQHIIIHCVYRNVLRYKSFKHALNAAAKGLRNGTWTTPKRVLAAETAERERLANEAKEQERRQCLESGFGRILGEAMRLTHEIGRAHV